MLACLLVRRHLLLPSASPIHFWSRSLLPYRGTSKSCSISGPSASFVLSKRSLSTTSSFQDRSPRKASTGWAITFALALICGGVWFQNRHSRSKNDVYLTPIPQDLPPQQNSFLGVIDTLKTMPTELPPGTIGNLTAEQEVKLQEFWALLLQIFGVKLDAIESAEEAPSSPSQEKKKQPKRRFGLFGRGKDDEDDTAPEKSATAISSGLSSIHITDGDDKYGQLKEFHQALADMSPEEMRTTFWSMVKQDNPDSLVLRFLRARKWDVKKALVMFISTIRWRLSDVQVDSDIMKNGEQHALKQEQSSDPAEKKAGEDFLNQMRMGKSFLHGVDKFGRPICVVRVRLHKAGEQSQEALDRFTVYTIESARMMLAPPVETACIIFDMTDFSLANMDYHPVKFMIKCFEANYPESLGVVLIHKAPWIFSGIWSIIKGWLDPVVAAKIQFTRNAKDLEVFIPRDRIMKELEGDENWKYKYVECEPDENKTMEDAAKRDELVAQRQELAQMVQDATVSWISAGLKDDKEAVAASKDKRNDLIERLRVQYWQLDPYLRARSLYDRLNVIQGDGKINFYSAESLSKGNAASSQ